MFKQIFLALAPATSTYAIDYSSCDKGLCFGVPAGCVETENCDAVVHITKNGANFHFELTANRVGFVDERQWIGVALGLDGGKGMGNDAAVACYLGLDGTTHVDNYWNDLEPYFSCPVADATGGLLDRTLEVTDEQISCSFDREPITTITTPNDPVEEVIVNLNEIPYHVMIGVGPLNPDTGNIKIHNIQGLTENPVVFPDLA